MIRKVRQEEIHHLYPFVYNILSNLGLPLLDRLDEDELTQIMIEEMESPRYRYGVEHAWLCVQDNQVAGGLFGYPGEYLSLVDGPLEDALSERVYSRSEINPNHETHYGER